MKKDFSSLYYLGEIASIAEKYEYEMPRMLAENNYYTYAIGKLHYAPQRNLHVSSKIISCNA